MWSRKISHSAMPRNRSRRRSRSVAAGAAGSGAAVGRGMTTSRFATIFRRVASAARAPGSPPGTLARPHGYCNNGRESIHLCVESYEVISRPPQPRARSWRCGAGNATYLCRDHSAKNKTTTRTSTMYRAITRNIEVVVKPRFVADRSSPENNYFFWAYTISITNNGDETVQLKTRHWRITDANGRRQEVRGAGVVGEEPVLKAGEAFEYTSGVPLQTPSGFMVGSYGMVSSGGEHFDIEVPAFSLDSVESKRTLN